MIFETEIMDIYCYFCVAMKQFFTRHILAIAFIQAIVTTVGSLYMSEVLHFPPCVLCWYQRIAMYPLVLLIGVGLFTKNKAVPSYVLPLSIFGWMLALYHALLYYHVLPNSYALCEQGFSCTSQYVSWFGFVTIPLLSLAAFSIIILCMIVYMRYRKEEVVHSVEHSFS